MWSVKDYQDVALILKVTPLRIGPGQMAKQQTGFWFGLIQERDVAGKRQSVLVLSNQRGETILNHEPSESFRIFNLKCWWYVHAGHKGKSLLTQRASRNEKPGRPHCSGRPLACRRAGHLPGGNSSHISGLRKNPLYGDSPGGGTPALHGRRDACFLLRRPGQDCGKFLISDRSRMTRVQNNALRIT